MPDSSVSQNETSDSLTFSVEQDFLDGGFVVSCDQYPGAISQGETASEAIRNCREAVEDIRALKGQDY